MELWNRVLKWIGKWLIGRKAREGISRDFWRKWYVLGISVETSYEFAKSSGQPLDDQKLLGAAKQICPKSGL